MMRHKWKVDSVHLEIVLISNVLEARKSFCTHRMELPGDMGHVESCFGLFRGSVTVGAR
jgi:hypothetical protein